jgi:hypothetical protein
VKTLDKDGLEAKLECPGDSSQRIAIIDDHLADLEKKISSKVNGMSDFLATAYSKAQLMEIPT